MYSSSGLELQLKTLLTGTDDPTEGQWSTALAQLLTHLHKNPIPKETDTTIPFDIPDELLLRSAINAHNQGTTLNQYIVNAVKALIDDISKEEWMDGGS